MRPRWWPLRIPLLALSFWPEEKRLPAVNSITAASPSSTCFASSFSPSLTSASGHLSAVVSAPWLDPVGVAVVGKDNFYESRPSFQINSTLHQKQRQSWRFVICVDPSWEQRRKGRKQCRNEFTLTENIINKITALGRPRGRRKRTRRREIILFSPVCELLMQKWKTNISVPFPILILAGGRIDDDKRLSRDVCLYEKQGSWTQRWIGRIIWSPSRWKKYCSWPKRSFGFFCYIVWKHTQTQEKTWTNFLSNPIQYWSSPFHFPISTPMHTQSIEWTQAESIWKPAQSRPWPNSPPLYPLYVNPGPLKTQGSVYILQDKAC